jgi:ribosome-associated protein
MRPNVRTDLSTKTIEARRHDNTPDTGKSKETALLAVKAALEKKCLEPVLLDVRELASYADYILVVSGKSDRQVQAVAEGVVEALKRENVRAIGTEGLKTGHWTLLDFGDVIVHVFYHPVRDFYDLESFWVDAPHVPIDVPAEARVSVEDMYES